MRSTDLNLMDATYVLLNSPHLQRIAPPLLFDEVFEFTLRYYVSFLRENPSPRGKPPMRYSAGWDLVAWFCHLWDSGVDKTYFASIKAQLAELYKSGDNDLKRAIEHAIIEHLFERRQVRKYFVDWQSDPELKPAYEEGLLWIKHGGTSPLSEHQDRVR
jgi:hypothetical protein